MTDLQANIEQSVDILAWESVDREMEEWVAAGRAPLFWWRDDDARRPSKNLDRLLGLSDVHGVPVVLSVIPDVDLADLAAVIRDRALIQPVQHGWRHVDGNKGGKFKTEFALDCPPAEVAAALNAGWRRISAAMDALPIYVPPWNQLTTNVKLALADTPLRCVSCAGPLGKASDGLLEINVHIGIANWNPARFRGVAAILELINKELFIRRRHSRWTEPIGLVTHHGICDEESWAFLDGFFRHASGWGPHFKWRSIREFMPL